MSISTNPSEFLDAKQSVLQRIATGVPAPAVPTTLPYKNIETIPELFQQRRITPEESAEHVQSLARAIKVGPRGAQQEALAPITIMWVGDAWACVDGHHRLGAYRLVNHAAPVPVNAMSNASLEDAVRASLSDNNKDKLKLTPRCRSEAAWRFTVAGGMSKAEVTALSGVNESTVASMRRTLREFQEAHPGVSPADFTWARMRLWKFEPSELGGKDADHRAAERLLRRTEKHLQAASPRVIFLALGMHKPGLIAELLKMHEDYAASEAYRAVPFEYIPSDEELNPEF